MGTSVLEGDLTRFCDNRASHPGWVQGGGGGVVGDGGGCNNSSCVILQKQVVIGLRLI